MTLDKIPKGWSVVGERRVWKTQSWVPPAFRVWGEEEMCNEESPVRWEEDEECIQGTWRSEPRTCGFSRVSGHHCGK